MEVTQKDLKRIEDSVERLAVITAEGFKRVDERFEQVDKRFEQVDKRFDILEADIKELRNEIRSIRAELEQIPDNVDATYSKTLNDLLERVGTIEKKLGISS